MHKIKLQTLEREIFQSKGVLKICQTSYIMLIMNYIQIIIINIKYVKLSCFALHPDYDDKYEFLKKIC